MAGANISSATASLTNGRIVVNDQGFRVASSDSLFNPTRGVTWPARSQTWSVDPREIPKTLRGGVTVNWPNDFNPVSPWLRVRDGSKEELDRRWRRANERDRACPYKRKEIWCAPISRR